MEYVGCAVGMYSMHVQVSVCKDGSLPVLLLCAVKLQQLPSSLLEHVANVSGHLCPDESPAVTQHQLLSFVPMSSLRGTLLSVL